MLVLCILIALTVGLVSGYMHRKLQDALISLQVRLDALHPMSDEQDEQESKSTFLEPMTEVEEEMAKREAIMKRINPDARP
jgi:hypothetical protein